MSQDNWDKIDSYLRGEMTERQRSEFEQELDTDSVLRDDYESLKSIVDVLTDYNAKRDSIARWEKEDMARVVGKESSSLWQEIWLTLLLVVAVFIIILPFSYMKQGAEEAVPAEIIDQSAGVYEFPAAKPTSEPDSLEQGLDSLDKTWIKEGIKK